MCHKHFDDAFKRLPRDLQWEILVDFVGGYVVRNNRLKRLIRADSYKQIMKHQFKLNPYPSRGRVWLKRPVEPVLNVSVVLLHALNQGLQVHFRSDGRVCEDDDDNDNDTEHLVPVSYAEFSRRQMFVVLFKSRYTGQLSYGYTNKSGQWYITEVNDSIVLPPYEKHVYPSYPYTNKKLGRRPLLRMTLYDPSPAVPHGLMDYEIQEWKKGNRLFPAFMY